MATFNFLNSEKRYIAGAFLPPSKMDGVKGSKQFTISPEAWSAKFGDILSDSEWKNEHKEVMSAEEKAEAIRLLKDKFKNRNAKKNDGDENS